MSNHVSWNRSESGWELYSWLYMRVSGIALLGLVGVHMVLLHLIDNVDTISYQLISVRYATPLWRTVDLVMLWLAMAHGLGGARIVIGDYVLSRGWRLAWLSVLWLVGFILVVYGSLVILTFETKT